MFASVNLTCISVSRPQSCGAWTGLKNSTLHSSLLEGSLKQGPEPALQHWATSAAQHKSLTTNSINVFGLEYLWLPVVSQSVVFCLGLNPKRYHKNWSVGPLICRGPATLRVVCTSPDWTKCPKLAGSNIPDISRHNLNLTAALASTTMDDAWPLDSSFGPHTFMPRWNKVQRQSLLSTSSHSWWHALWDTRVFTWCPES